MGKQINFYMSENTQEEFIKFLIQREYVFLNNNSNVVERPELSNNFMLYLYKANYGKIVIHSSREAIDSIKSPVIQFSKTIIKEEKKRICRGRLWIEEQFYDNEGEIVKKEAQFVNDYKDLRNWIKKNVPYREINKGTVRVKEYANDEIIEMQELGFVLSL